MLCCSLDREITWDLIRSGGHADSEERHTCLIGRLAREGDIRGAFCEMRKQHTKHVTKLSLIVSAWCWP